MTIDVTFKLPEDKESLRRLHTEQSAIQAQITSKANADKAQQKALEAKARSDKMVAEAVARETAKTAAAEQELKRARLKAESVRVRAEAYAKRANATANDSLDAKLNAWVEANKAWRTRHPRRRSYFQVRTEAERVEARKTFILCS